ncbi:MAG: AraC family transcriptional regulator [Bacteroidota bacterium]
MNALFNARDSKRKKSSSRKMTGKGTQAGSANHFQKDIASSPREANQFSGKVRYNRFMERITLLIESNIDDENYGIDQLCRDAGASRTQIHNKIKKWTGLSTSFFIRAVRLKRAQYLLLNSDLNVSQIAYEVGFRDSSYFSRVFHQSVGLSPKDFRKRHFSRF